MVPALVAHIAARERWSRSRRTRRKAGCVLSFKRNSQVTTQNHSEWIEYTERATLKLKPKGWESSMQERNVL